MSKEKSILSKRAESISPSLTLAITAKAKKLKSEGVSIIGFGAGEPDFGTPDYIIEAAKTALDKNLTKYTESSGTLELRTAIAKKLLKDNGLTYDPKQIIVSNGGKHALLNAVLAVCDEGDEVLIPAPYWLTYPELVKMAGATPVFIESQAKNNFKITAEELNNAITDKTKLLILNSPSNPTGAVYSRSELSALAKVIVERDILVISDEIYERLVYNGAEHVSIASFGEEIKKRTILVNGLSKCYSMTGWRVGYLAADNEITKAIDGLQSHGTSNINTIAQYASVAALSSEKGEEFLTKMVIVYDERRKYMVDKIKTIENLDCIVPDGAFYVFVDITKLVGKTSKGRAIKDALDVTEFMLESGIAVIPGNPFGADFYIRLSYAIDIKDIKEGLSRIEQFVQGLV